MSDDASSPDQVPGAPHPRETGHLVGQVAAEAAFLEAYRTGRLHHAWLLTGPRGCGKATLAYRLARFLIATPEDDDGGLFGAPEPPTTLDIAPDHPVANRVLAQSEPALRIVRRSENPQTGRMRDTIVVDDIRKLGDFFHLSVTEGGRRVVIVDCADDLNTAAANALLKMLEEPPAKTVLLLVCHQPARLLPTIRSRCRTLRLAPLGAEDMALALSAAGADPQAATIALNELARGSVGAALDLLNLDGLEIYSEIIALLGTLPQLDRARAIAFADAAAQRNATDKLDLRIRLINVALARLARHGASGTAAPEAAENEARIFARLAPHPQAARLWAERAGEVSSRLAHGRAVNLDPAALLLDTLIKLGETARAIPEPSPA